MPTILRAFAEQEYAHELEEIAQQDKGKRPENWRLSPQAVVTYVMGGTLANGFEVSPKYIGSRRLIEIAVATLVTDRALLLYGLPGTAKSWVSEHLSAAISGNSTLLLQGTAGTSEDAVRYGWNYARLLSDGPSEAALVTTPLLKAMQTGAICRIEELTRMSPEVQDTLITVLSEKLMPIPELNQQVQAVGGFNVIATANNRDKGVNELSGALKRRFNTVVLPTPATQAEEVDIVQRRVRDFSQVLDIPVDTHLLEEIGRIVTIFRELRSGVTTEGNQKIKSPGSTLSTAEAISVVNNGLVLAAHFGDGQLSAEDVASSLVGAIVKDPVQDATVWNEYLETVVKRREGWDDVYRACQEHA
jgi:MoxR-like ATPase